MMHKNILLNNATTTPANAVYVGGTTASFLGTATSFTASLTSLTGGVASSPSAGDLVIIYFSIALAATLSVSGYTEVTTVSANDTYDTTLWVGYKYMGATPDTSVTLTGGTGAQRGMTAAIQVWRNISGLPIESFATFAGSNGALANPPSVTPLNAGNIIIAGGAASHVSGAQTFTSSDLTSFMTVGIDAVSSDSTIGLGYKTWSGSGAFDPAAFGYTGTSASTNSNAAVSLVLVPAGTKQFNYEKAGTYSFVVPAGVTSISAVAVGGGNGGGSRYGGAGANLRYKNNISVTSGETLTIVVGAGGTGTNTTGTTGGNAGGNSSIARSGTNLLLARGGGQTTTEVFDGGGVGGAGGAPLAQSSAYGTVYNGGGGGGAGGYAGAGGAGGGTAATAGSGGGGGGGSRSTAAPNYWTSSTPYTYYGNAGSPGGGVGIYGQGSNGAAGSGNGSVSGTQSAFGAGGNGNFSEVASTAAVTEYTGGAGTAGAVRLIWPGSSRQYPSTRTVDE